MSSKKLKYLGIMIDDNAKECYVDGSPIHLQRLEYLVLSLLITNIDKVYTADEIGEKVWGKEIDPRIFPVIIYKLRKKIGPYRGNIHTVHGFGYKMK